MQQFRVLIPEDNFELFGFMQDSLPGIAVINSGLEDSEPKEVFAWHCSIILHFKDLIDNGMPSVADRTLAERFEDRIDPLIKGPHSGKPDALYVGRITHNATRELV